MDKQLFENLKPEDRAQALADNCTRIEDRVLQRPFDQDELKQKKDVLAELSVRKQDLEDKKASLTAEINNQIKPIKKEKRQLTTDIKMGFVESEETVYLFADHANDMMLTYDANGELYDSRPLRENEKQGTIYDLNQKTGS